MKTQLKGAKPTVSIELVNDKWLVMVLEQGTMVFSEACETREESIFKLENFLQRQYIS